MKKLIAFLIILFIISAIAIGINLLNRYVQYDFEKSKPDGLNVETRVAFLKDGNNIIFNARIDGKEQIFKFNLETQKTQQLTCTGANMAPDVSPSNNRTVFISDRNGSKELYVMDESGAGQRRLTNNKTEEFPPSFCPDGSKIVFQRVSKNHSKREIIVLNMGDFTENQIMAYDYTRYYQDPVFLDNNTVRFESVGWVCLIDVSQKKEISRTEKIEPSYYPIFSRDKKKVAFDDFVNEYYTEGSGGGVYEVFIADSNGNRRIRITNNKNCSRPRTFTPDGQHVVFISGAPKDWGNLALWQVDINGKNAKQFNINLK